MGERQLLPQFTITQLKVGDFEVAVPEGLSELINRAGAWGIKIEDHTYLGEYKRQVEKRDGKIFTVLTKKA